MVFLKRLLIISFFISAMICKGYAQDSTSTDDLVFTEIQSDVVDSTVKPAQKEDAKTVAAVPGGNFEVVKMQWYIHNILNVIFY
ncbi:hypothetical protein GJU39_18760 [Pedobacter petrophilus]|uniref:Uncharacterized protein n=1 Tax=Pedobacter petrophilus TaxID=1908241 RepID=A0A7K0G403_9SPHI|nr:hypothetical protein [Pedobacter petrophilus]MRX78124.1 hypothetical protein [Pedobacter petrophilus]